MPKPPKIDTLYKRSLRIIERDITHLYRLVGDGKLSADNSMDLGRYVKLLADMKKAKEAIDKRIADEAKAAAKDVSDEELEATLKANK